MPDRQTVLIDALLTIAEYAREQRIQHGRRRAHDIEVWCRGEFARVSGAREQDIALGEQVYHLAIAGVPDVTDLAEMGAGVRELVTRYGRGDTEGGEVGASGRD